MSSEISVLLGSVMIISYLEKCPPETKRICTKDTTHYTYGGALFCGTCGSPIEEQCSSDEEYIDCNIWEQSEFESLVNCYLDDEVMRRFIGDELFNPSHQYYVFGTNAFYFYGEERIERLSNRSDKHVMSEELQTKLIDYISSCSVTDVRVQYENNVIVQWYD